jgi:hypothetical protein
MKLPPLPPLKASWSLFALAGTLVLVAAVSGGQEDKAVVEPAPRRHAAADAERTAADNLRLPLEKFNRPEVGEGEKNLFAAKSWYVPPPPPPPPKPRPPPPPSAPPLPFTFLGTFQESPERLVIFLVKGDRIYTVSTGDVIENTYRVEQAAGGKLTLRYLPLNIPQILAIGETS